MRGFVQRCVARGAGVDAGAGEVLVEGGGAGRFGAFLADDAELLCGARMLATEGLG